MRTRTVRIRPRTLDAARALAANLLGRPPDSDATAFDVLVAAVDDERLAALADGVNASLRIATVSTAIHVAGIAAPGTEFAFDQRGGWGLIFVDGSTFPLGHAGVPGVVAALERRGVELGQTAETD